MIPDLNLVEPVIRLGPVGRLRDITQPIMLGDKTNRGKISPPGPVGQHVRMVGRMEMMAKPDPVGPYEERDELVYPEFNEGRGEHHIQLVADGPGGLVRTRHPVGNVMLPALQDGVRPSAGGPVGQVPDPCLQIRSQNSSPDDSYQPLVTGPLGANVSDALNDACQPLVGDPVDRPTRLDPVGPREMFSLGDVIKPASIGPVGRPWTTDFEWCVECVNRLIWGFLVSCVVSIVWRNRSVGMDVFIKGSDVLVSIGALLDGRITPCDAMRACLWRTEDFKDTLNNVMLGRGAKMISHDVPGGEDNGQVLPITKEVQSQEEGCDIQPNIRRLEEGDGTALMTGGGPDTGPGTMSGPRRGEAFSVPAPQLHQPPPPSEVPDWSDGEAMPLIIIENSSDVLRLSPAMNSSGDPGILSAPLSPNRVRKGHSQDMPAEGSLFDVSPDIPGFHMRPAGASVQQADITEPPPPNHVGFNNPFFGTPIAFAQCQNTAGMDTTTTLPVYSIPRNCSVGMDQSAVPTVYASGVSPDSIPWSTAEDIIRDIAREGPFDADTTPMDTKECPLIHASMPGCPFRMTSYTGPSTVDADTSYGLQLHHPRFLEFIGAPESARLLNQSPSFWVDRLGQESAMAAAVNLQRDAGFMMTNLQILGQFVMSLHRMSAEMLSIGVDHVVFPVDEVDRLSVMPRAQRAAKYMSAMGLWRPPSGVGTPGPLPLSTCMSCMQCESCFGRRGPSAQ